jgi:hypothetical protein
MLSIGSAKVFLPVAIMIWRWNSTSAVAIPPVSLRSTKISIMRTQRRISAIW